jgi:hypothetical protein
MFKAISAITLVFLAAVGGVEGVITLRGAFEPESSFDVRTWTNYSSPDFVFPELSDDEFGMPALAAKPSVGVALGGGGFRAGIMALGWIRGLHEVGLACSGNGAAAAQKAANGGHLGPGRRARQRRGAAQAPVWHAGGPLGAH